MEVFSSRCCFSRAKSEGIAYHCCWIAHTCLPMHGKPAPSRKELLFYCCKVIKAGGLGMYSGFAGLDDQRWHMLQLVPSSDEQVTNQARVKFLEVKRCALFNACMSIVV